MISDVSKLKKGSVLNIDNMSFKRVSIVNGVDNLIITSDKGMVYVFDRISSNDYVVTNIITAIEPTDFKERLELEKAILDEKIEGLRSFLKMAGDLPTNNLFKQIAQIPHLDFESMELVKLQLRNTVDLADTIERRINYTTKTKSK